MNKDLDKIQESIWNSMGVPEHFLEQGSTTFNVGYWTRYSYGTTLDSCLYEYKCSECGNTRDNVAPICPKCLARMVTAIDDRLLTLINPVVEYLAKEKEIDGQVSIFELIENKNS